MKAFQKPYIFAISLAGLLILSACTTGRSTRPTVEQTRPATGHAFHIMSPGTATAHQMEAYLLKHNPRVKPSYAKKLAEHYIRECATEGVNHDVAFAQMCHETNFLKFGNQVSAKQNNFAGIGAVDGGAAGAKFPTPRIGVRAQVQHLVAYASTKQPKMPIVDPRFGLVKKRGCARDVYQLAGKWASDRDYGKKLEKKMRELWAMPR